MGDAVYVSTAAVKLGRIQQYVHQDRPQRRGEACAPKDKRVR